MSIDDTRRPLADCLPQSQARKWKISPDSLENEQDTRAAGLGNWCGDCLNGSSEPIRRSARIRKKTTAELREVQKATEEHRDVPQAGPDAGPVGSWGFTVHSSAGEDFYFGGALEERCSILRSPLRKGFGGPLLAGAGGAGPWLHGVADGGGEPTDRPKARGTKG